MDLFAQLCQSSYKFTLEVGSGFDSSLCLGSTFKDCQTWECWSFGSISGSSAHEKLSPSNPSMSSKVLVFCVIFGDLITDFRSVTSTYLFKIVNIHFALLYRLHTIKPTLHLYMNLFVPVEPVFFIIKEHDVLCCDIYHFVLFLNIKCLLIQCKWKIWLTAKINDVHILHQFIYLIHFKGQLNWGLWSLQPFKILWTSSSLTNGSLGISCS